jgi:23S rRNA-/tRNA-specific pseudouridylate synthase
MEVTKVRLLPRTGRRHQLRVHSMCLGHPIVGDFTYNPVHRDAVLADDAIIAQRDHNMRNTDGNASEGMLVGGPQEQNSSSHCNAAGGEPLGGSLRGGDIAERMMLHAHRLR